MSDFLKQLPTSCCDTNFTHNPSTAAHIDYKCVCVCVCAHVRVRVRVRVCASVCVSVDCSSGAGGALPVFVWQEASTRGVLDPLPKVQVVITVKHKVAFLCWGRKRRWLLQSEQKGSRYG
eukprot:5303194-Amphidinium_carterae.1